ncbi:hypothetical protein FXB39_14165 [Nocardioides sp. BGMRC 2183]|nr:hypothetical protein FXB39_14165 [Nocardioides sp. BGMRC 2183]
MSHLLIPRRFQGPPSSGNGGWTAGALAQHLPGGARDATVTVRLRLPPPLEVPLEIDDSPAGAGARRVLTDDVGRPVAEAVLSEDELIPVPPIDVLAAADAEAGYPGLRQHVFPECFVCGPDRRPGDGLRIFPGPATTPRGREIVAGTWTPYESDVPITWAALDCPGGWATDLLEQPRVLGTMTARIDRLPSTRERYVVVGEQRAIEGRKALTAASLYGEDSGLVATAEHTWIAIDPRTFD